MKVESHQQIPRDEFGNGYVRLHHQHSPTPVFATYPEMPNDGLATEERRIDQVYGMGRFTTAKILLDVGINPYKAWPTTTEFTNID